MRAFLDTNILIYAQQAGPKAAIAQALIAPGGAISVQVLNELTNVLRNKLRRDWVEIGQVLDDVRYALGEAPPLTIQTHAAALSIATHHALGFYDALIVAAAIEADCDTLFSEDLQHERSFGGLTIRNTFFKTVRRSPCKPHERIAWSSNAKPSRTNQAEQTNVC